MTKPRSLWLLGSSIALALSLVAYLMAPAFSPALILSLISVPVAAICGRMGARRTAIIAVYFGVCAWLPLWFPTRTNLSFENVFLVSLTGGVLLILAVAFWQRAKTPAA